MNVMFIMSGIVLFNWRPGYRDISPTMKCKWPTLQAVARYNHFSPLLDDSHDKGE